jgi:hypothetical protein
VLAAALADRGEPPVRVGGVAVERDVGQLVAAHDALLLVDRQLVPRHQVEEVLLHEQEAAAGVLGVLGTDQGSLGRGRTARVLRPVDEAQQVAVVEVAEPLDVQGDAHRPAQRHEDLQGELLAGVRVRPHPLAGWPHSGHHRRQSVGRPDSLST